MTIFNIFENYFLKSQSQLIITTNPHTNRRTSIAFSALPLEKQND